MLGTVESVGELQVISYSWIVGGILLLTSAYFLSRLVDIVAFFQRELELLPEEEKDAIKKILNEPLYKDDDN